MDPGDPNTPSKKKGKCASLLQQFPDLDIGGSSSGSPSSSKTSKYSLRGGLKGTFSKGWPPSLRLGSSAPDFSGQTFTIGMSSDYRYYDDKWRTDKSLKDKPYDVTRVGSGQGLSSGPRPARGLSLDETFKMCMKIFNGEAFEYSERSADYQEKLNQWVTSDQNTNKNPNYKEVVRTRREVVQHAAALQHLIQQFVKENEPLSEQLIRDTHKIMMEGLSGEDAGVVGTKSLAGTYRAANQQAYIGGGHQFPKPSEIPTQMQSMVNQLKADLAQAEQKDQLDPFALAAKYCDRFVNIHPFKDGNGRMCRLILNAILLKYAGIIMSLGEKGEGRNEYISIAVESRQSGGHHGQLASMVLHNAEETMKRWKKTLEYKMSRKQQ
ncbi:uncharacterized protein MYCFIDRAFT_198278 [Pseudocercospora fijiensis CIRAD86]|uniref:Fido domain-containing protein n=1 Tax=Pseudocercospora fijiensis (strain CIRAD86) TaxID=383855 RepID=M2ZLE8_PSEFD|nr:uncharacterized protein MYCFIDRAFT_198278 [Pseudocercospora fijiensis CIRAD86]EME79899.1 hypothetical protein MYCFIDRAFT_198278 [Pseudocercospora fijiensis CIRAD86]